MCMSFNEYIQNNIINSTMKLLCCLCILVVSFFYPDNIENKYKLNDPNKNYVPKSKRLDKGSNINKLMKKFVQSKGSRIDRMT